MPEHADGLADYYEKARLFVLEIKTETSFAERFPAFSLIEEGDKEESEPDEWFTISADALVGRTLSEDEIPLQIHANLYQPGFDARLTEIQRTSEKTSAQLRKAVSTAHISSASESEIDSALAKSGTVEWAVVYDVGQGNAIGLCGSSGSVEMYFEFGGGVLGNWWTFPRPLTDFCFSTQPSIILSHWDFDHWSSANRDATSLKSTWIAPRQPVGPSHLALMNSIIGVGKLLLVPPNLTARWRGQFYLELCTGKGRNHSGLALTFSQRPDGNGERMLFPGDAYYTYIASFRPNDYVSVVAPHHGANMPYSTTPHCLGQPHSRLVYSYGQGNTYNHPSQITQKNHDANGWHDRAVTTGASSYEVRETAVRGKAAFGHVLLGWKIYGSAPPLQCGSIPCQLQAQSHQL